MVKYSGVSAFALMHSGYPLDALLATLDFSPAPATAILWGTFADSSAATTARIKQFTDRYNDKPHLLEVHPLNNTAIRNRKQYAGEPFPQFNIAQLNYALEKRDPATLATITARIQEIKAVMEVVRNPNTYLVMTTGLEDDYSQKAFQIISAEIAKTWPYFLIRSGASFGTFPREAHGNSAKAGGTVVFVNEDGAIQSLSQTKAWLAKNDNAMCKLIWRPAHQGRNANTNDFGKPPRDRTFIYTAEDVTSLGLLLGPYPVPNPQPQPDPMVCPVMPICPVPLVPQSTVPGGGYPMPTAPTPPAPPAPSPGTNLSAICPSVRPCSNGILWKPESEDSGGTREGKPVVIFANEVHGKTILGLYASNGVQIGSMGYYGDHNGKGSRYYSGWTGGSMDLATSLQSKAVAASGSKEIYIKLENSCVGPIIPTQRTGD